MKYSICLMAVLLYCLVNVSNLCSQTSFMHFTTREGLPSNKVYCVEQDASGFMWLGTDNGLVRYNGSEFKTFTVKDGLPDNDVFGVFEDRQNRLWILSPKQGPCFFYKNKLYTTGNDSFLAKYFTGSEMFRYSINKNLKRILFYVIHEKKLTMLEYGGPVQCKKILIGDPLGQLKGVPFQLFHDGKKDYLINDHFLHFMGCDSVITKHYYVYLSDQVKCGIGNVGFFFPVRDNRIFAFTMRSDSMHIEKIYQIPQCMGVYSSPQNEIIFVTQKNEIYTLNNATLEAIKEDFTPEGRITTASIDHNSNKWVCTHDNGVFVYPKHSSNIHSNKKGATRLTWNPYGHELIAGFEDNSASIFNEKKTRSFVVNTGIQWASRVTGLVYYENFLYIGTDHMFGRLNPNTGEFRMPISLRLICTIKDMELYPGRRILFGGSNGAGFYLIDSNKVIDTIWMTKTLAVSAIPGRGIFLGTVNGLHFREEGQSVVRPYITGTNLDKARITNIKHDHQGRLWVGTGQFGLFIIDGKHVINLDDSRNSPHFITSYYVKCIFIDDEGTAWVGTDKGINRIRYTNPGNCRIDRIVSSFGIPYDNITALHVEGDTVYMATPNGISSFNYRSAILQEVPGLEITGIYINGSKLPDAERRLFDYSENHISIEYSAIAYKSPRNIEFEYRLVNIDKKWVRTASNRVDLSDMNPGQYRFEIKAINTISGEESQVRFFEFEIKTPWYRTYSFIGFVLLASGGIIWFLIRRRIKNIRKQSQEQSRVNKQFAELEMQALRAQMNPHFIFNALSAIQYYFVNNDEEKANAYMSKFARLIRQMLDYSKDNFISLEEEVSLLRNYMVLEKMRFEEKLDFYLSVDDKIDMMEYVLPSLLLQPILENAVNHGVRPLKTKGTISLKIYLDEPHLVCEIMDNGIGINQSKRGKIAPSGHQSKGMEILTKRIESINYLYSTSVLFELTDLSETDTEQTGTKIVIRFPLSLVTTTSIDI